MGSCCNGELRTLEEQDQKDEGEKIIENDFFSSVGISLYKRPSTDELRNIWAKFDLDGDGILLKLEAEAFLKAVCDKYAVSPPCPASELKLKLSQFQILDPMTPDDEGCITNTTTTTTTTAESKIDENLSLSWKKIYSLLWKSSIDGVQSITIEFLRNAFQKIDLDGKGNTESEAVKKISKKLLKANHVDPEECNKALEILEKCENDENISFRYWVELFGPVYEKHCKPWKSGLAESGRGDLPLDVGPKIDGFVPSRTNVPVEFLINGKDTLMAMLDEIEQAKVEICMSWWEFLYNLPVLRGSGVEDWNNPRGTLPPVLKRKAEEGVKIYILLWNISFVMETDETALKAAEVLEAIHPNIKVIDHPKIFPLTYSHHQKFIVVDRRVAILGGIDWTANRWDTSEHPLFDPEHKTHPGMDFKWKATRDKNDVANWLNNPMVDSPPFDRNEVPRKPWQDIDLRVWGDAAKDVATNFIQRWNFIRQDVVEILGDGLRDGMPDIPEEIKDDFKVDLPPSAKLCRCQIIRCIGQWSLGMPTEISHYLAYISAINAAEHYIYVENQYVIGNMGEGAAKNRVIEAILNRIEWAFTNDKLFHVYIVIPDALTPVPAVDPLHYFMRRSLLQGDGCLMARVEKMLEGSSKTVDNFLSICSLQKVEKSVSGKWNHSSIFVHSKVLIVDDKVAIVGSANINDRSFLGDADSELGAIVWDDNNTGIVKNFRINLWLPFLGLEDCKESRDLISDAISTNKLFQLWTQTAHKNLELLSAVYPDTPQNSITSFTQWYDLIEQKPEPREPGKMKDFKGQVVKFPRYFLGDKTKRYFLEVFAEDTPLIRNGFL